MALWLRLALLSSCWNSSGFGKQGPSSATGQTSLRSRRGAILRDLGATTAGWCAGSAPAPESSVTFEAAQGLSGIGRQPEEPMYSVSIVVLLVSFGGQKENEYGEVSLVDLGWRGKSASEPRDR